MTGQYSLAQISEDPLANNTTNPITQPLLSDRGLKVETVATGFDFRTSIAFLGKDDILLLEKNTGRVYRVVDGNITNQVIQLNVSFKDERGLLGIAISGDTNSKREDRLVFLYYTYCPKIKHSTDNSSQTCSNFVYRYTFDRLNSKLIEPQLILSLPALPGPSHNGGVLVLDGDENLYVSTGDLQSTAFNKNQSGFDTKAQNIINGTSPDGRAGILRMTSEGGPVSGGFLGKEYPLNLYYAYGVKNSFGIDIDPISGNLWDTEHGSQFGDEINLVNEGFNSGWEKAQGIWKLNQTKARVGTYYEGDTGIEFEDFDGIGKYSNPEFVWDKPVGPTALVFLQSNKLGEKYQDDMFVGSVKKGIIYHFDVNEDRKSLLLDDDLADLVLNKGDNVSKIIFGENFGIVTDLEEGHDGYLYIVSGSRGTDEGAIYRIVSQWIELKKVEKFVIFVINILHFTCYCKSVLLWELCSN
ncbi:MAG TPA: PQQ-dependent sugar dehydrogenase [Nitrososphaeraceae archaeon]|nr:PQQ-dependent sugar dehydrogenase [Nitrososphaeraceae archaeon]